MKKIEIPNFVKYILAIVPFIWIFSIIEIQELKLIIKNTAIWTVPLILIANIMAFILQGTRWWMLIHCFIPTVSYLKAMRYHFIGLFYSIILPSSAAQDVVRTVLISREEDYGVIWASSWIARLFGMISLFLMSLYGFLQYDQIRNIENLPIILSSFVLFAVLLVVMSFSKRTTRPFRIILEKILPKKVIDIISKIRHGIYLFRSKKTILLKVFLMTMLVQIILFTTLTMIVYGITGELKFKEMFAFAPIVEFICMMLPITPNGMGIREILSKKMFEHMGLSDEALAVYVTVIFISIIFRTIGVIPLLTNKSEREISYLLKK